MTIIEESPTKAKQIATATFVLVFSVLLLGGGLPDHRQYQILSSSGRNLTSIFQDLRPSRQASPRRLLTAGKSACPGVPSKDAIQSQPSERFLTVSMQQGHEGRYVPVQGPNCGGSYGICDYGLFCTISCTYNNCYAGGNDYCTGWLTQYWNGCCYTSNTCFTENCD